MITAQLDRISDIRQILERQKLDGLIVYHLPHIRYLTGFSGSNAVLIILQKSLHFITDGRYKEQIKTELLPLPGLHTHIEREVWKYVAEKKLFGSAKQLGFEAAHIAFASVKLLRKALKPVKLKPVLGIVERVVISKTAQEVRHIRIAADIAADVYAYILNMVQPGMSENEIAAEISYQAKKRGSEADAFEIIVASGERGSLPHGRASEKLLKKGELITLDFGCRVNGFHSDLTRTFALGTPKEFDTEIYHLVLAANTAAIQAARGNINVKELDAVARDIITAAGYEKEFEHSLGHGLGLEVHEKPSVSYRFPEVKAPTGAVITIEPGVYIPGRCGVRIEDDVWLTETGCEVLTDAAPKELIVV